MRRTSIIAALAAALLTASPALGSAPERFEDATGDALGDAPDIVAVTVSEGEQRDIQVVPGSGPGALLVPDLGLTTPILTVADPEGDDHGRPTGRPGRQRPGTGCR